MILTAPYCTCTKHTIVRQLHHIIQLMLSTLHVNSISYQVEYSILICVYAHFLEVSKHCNVLHYILHMKGALWVTLSTACCQSHSEVESMIHKTDESRIPHL